MATVIVDPKPSLRAIGVNGSTQVNIEQLDWCLENSLTRDTEVYLMLQGQKSKLIEIVRLVGGQPYDKTHTIYRVNTDQNFRINDEQVLAKLIILEKGKSSMRTTNTIAFIIKTENYELIRQIAIAQELGLAVEAYYQAIAAMYNELKKGEIIDDNEDQ